MTSSTSRLTVEERIQALAQELQDQILECTLIAGVKHQEFVAITKSYKPPWQLGVNRITRKTVAQAYYGATIFQVDIGGDRFDSRRKIMSMAKKWLASLPEHERSGISQLRFKRSRPALPAYCEHAKRLSLSYQRQWFQL